MESKQTHEEHIQEDYDDSDDSECSKNEWMNDYYQRYALSQIGYLKGTFRTKDEMFERLFIKKVFKVHTNRSGEISLKKHSIYAEDLPRLFCSGVHIIWFIREKAYLLLTGADIEAGFDFPMEAPGGKGTTGVPTIELWYKDRGRKQIGSTLSITCNSMDMFLTKDGDIYKSLIQTGWGDS